MKYSVLIYRTTTIISFLLLYSGTVIKNTQAQEISESDKISEELTNSEKKREQTHENPRLRVNFVVLFPNAARHKESKYQIRKTLGEFAGKINPEDMIAFVYYDREGDHIGFLPAKEGEHIHARLAEIPNSASEEAVFISGLKSSLSLFKDHDVETNFLFIIGDGTEIDFSTPKTERYLSGYNARIWDYGITSVVIAYNPDGNSDSFENMKKQAGYNDSLYVEAKTPAELKIQLYLMYLLCTQSANKPYKPAWGYPFPGLGSLHLLYMLVFSGNFIGVIILIFVFRKRRRIAKKK